MKFFIKLSSYLLILSAFILLYVSPAFANGVTLSWSSKTDMSNALIGVGAAVLEGKVYTFGGTVNGSSGTTAINEYNPITNSWITHQTSLAFGQYFSAVVVNNDKAYIVGGQGNKNDLEEYDTFTDTITRLADIPGQGHSVHGAAVVNGKIYAIAGAPTNNTVDEYDIATDTWRARANLPTPRQALAVAVVNGKIYAIGGIGSSVLSTVEEYDPATDTWTTKSSMPIGKYQISSVTLSNDKIYVVGGVNQNFEVSNTVEEYDPATDTWATVENMPTSRYGVGLAADFNKFYAIGGGDNLNGLSPTKTVELASLVSPNIPPQVNPFSGNTINEGDTYSANSSFSDLDSTSWTATVDYGDGSGVQPLTLSGTNFSLSHVYNTVGTYTITVSVTDNQGATGAGTATITVQRQLVSLSPAKVWVGLKNSDDVGVKFDLKAETYAGSTLISSGETDSVVTGSSGFNNAKLDTINFSSFSPVDFPLGTILSVKLYVRNACTGSGHNSGTARLWYNDSVANSQFGATIGTDTNPYYLVSSAALSTSVGSGPKQTVDVQAGTKCSDFKLFGTWSITP